MATLADLLAHRERLLNAAASGTRRIRDSNGEEIEYRSQSELHAALRMINREIQIAESELGCSRITYLRTSKGL